MVGSKQCSRQEHTAHSKKVDAKQQALGKIW